MVNSELWTDANCHAWGGKKCGQPENRFFLCVCNCQRKTN